MRISELNQEKLGDLLIRLVIAARQNNYKLVKSEFKSIDSKEPETEFLKDLFLSGKMDEIVYKWFGSEENLK